jgi:hypothetical protein
MKKVNKKSKSDKQEIRNIIFQNRKPAESDKEVLKGFEKLKQLKDFSDKEALSFILSEKEILRKLIFKT